MDHLGTACCVVNSWLLPDQPEITRFSLHAMMARVHCVVRQAGTPFDDSLWIVSLLYGERFVRRMGLLEDSTVFWVMLMGAVTALKFWLDDICLDMELLAYASGMRLHDILHMERSFLLGLDYQLSTSSEELSRWWLRAVHHC